MNACPCCGYRTIPNRAAYDLCPVCWWEDEGVEPWQYSDANGQILVEAQQEYLADQRPYRQRPGQVRAPRPAEARDPAWQPYALTDDLAARMREETDERQRRWDAEAAESARRLAADPEGWFADYNAAVRALGEQVTTLSHRQITARLRQLGRDHRVGLPDHTIERFARMMKDEGYYRGHPIRSGWWLLRYARPGSFRRRSQELRTGTYTFMSAE